MRLLLLLVIISPALAGEQDIPETMPETESWSTRVGGWADLMFLDGDDDRRPQYFDLPHFYLYLDTRINDRWRTMVEMDYQNPPKPGVDDPQGVTTLERAYIEYKQNVALKLRLGRFYTPAGLWREKQGMIMVDSNMKPIIEDMRWLPMMSEGLEALGSKAVGRLEWDYAAFLSRDEDMDGNRGLGFGLDLSVTWDERFRFGFFHMDFSNSGEGLDKVAGDRKGLMFYTENHLVPDKLLLRAEWLKADRENAGDADGYYGKLKWNMTRKLFTNLRFDHADDLHFDTRHRVYRFTLGYRPIPRLRARAEFATHDLEQAVEPRYNEWSLWVGYLFDFNLK